MVAASGVNRVGNLGKTKLVKMPHRWIEYTLSREVPTPMALDPSATATATVVDRIVEAWAVVPDDYRDYTQSKLLYDVYEQEMSSSQRSVLIASKYQSNVKRHQVVKWAKSSATEQVVKATYNLTMWFQGFTSRSLDRGRVFSSWRNYLAENGLLQDKRKREKSVVGRHAPRGHLNARVEHRWKPE